MPERRFFVLGGVAPDDGDFYPDRQGRIRHRHPHGWSDPYGHTLYARVNGRSVKVAYWCPSCSKGLFIQAPW